MFILLALLTAWTLGVVTVMSLCLAAKLGDRPEETRPALEPLTLAATRSFDFSLN
jgi:hypothetical protein